jgi:hypothetical protein
VAEVRQIGCVRKKGTVYMLTDKQISQLADEVFGENPEAIGMAVAKMDCGCIVVVGVTEDGEKAGKPISINSGDCLLCMNDPIEALNPARMESHTVLGKNGKPSDEPHKLIWTKVFGNK